MGPVCNLVGSVHIRSLGHIVLPFLKAVLVLNIMLFPLFKNLNKLKKQSPIKQHLRSKHINIYKYIYFNKFLYT